MLADTQQHIRVIETFAVAEPPKPTVSGIALTRDFLISQRQALLMQLDSLERLLQISPRTAQLRKEMKGE